MAVSAKYALRLYTTSYSKRVEIPCVDGVFRLDHGCEYEIGIANYDDRRIDATLEIDGHLVGTFRLDAKRMSVIEHPITSARRFTFYASDSTEGRSLGGGTGSIVVTIRRELDRRVYKTRETYVTDGPSDQSDGVECDSSTNDDDGRTGLGRVSTQEFGIAQEMETETTTTVLHATMKLRPKPSAPQLPVYYVK